MLGVSFSRVLLSSLSWHPGVIGQSEPLARLLGEVYICQLQFDFSEEDVLPELVAVPHGGLEGAAADAVQRHAVLKLEEAFHVISF